MLELSQLQTSKTEASVEFNHINFVFTFKIDQRTSCFLALHLTFGWLDDGITPLHVSKTLMFLILCFEGEKKHILYATFASS